MQINMLGVFTDQLAEMRIFYHELLEMPIVCELESYIEFGDSGIRFSICERKVMIQTLGEEHYGSPAEGHPFSLAFECQSCKEVQDEYDKLIERGATPIQEPSDMPWGQRTAFFADPDGNIHELFTNLR